MSNLKEKIDFVNRLYGLIIEASKNQAEEEVLAEIDIKNDSYINQSLAFIRKLNTQASAELNKSRFTQAQKTLEELITSTGDNIEAFFKGLLSEPENKEMLAFFSNYKSMSDADKKAMLLDNKILEIISKAKKKSES
jgi:hypothetical protein